MGARSRLGLPAASWEATWFPKPIEGIADHSLALVVDLATRAYSMHAGIRPAALLPVEAHADDAFAMALRRVEFESSRLLQAQILALKGPQLEPFRDAVSTALERRHAEIGKLWTEALEGVGITIHRAEWRKALMQIKGALVVLLNITVIFDFSSVAC